jgi:replicative DNA helicase
VNTRVLPHNADAEKSVLGGILLRNEALNELPTLEEEDFYDPRHKAVFAAMRSLEARSKPIDPITLEEQLNQAGKLEAIGGLAYLAELALTVPTADNIVHYAEIVAEKNSARKLMLAAQEIVAKGYADYGDAREYLDQAEAKIFEVTQRMQRGGPQHAKQLLQQFFKTLDGRFAAEDGITGIPSGFNDLDERTGGLQPSDLIILAARPGMGKTALAMSIVQNCAMSQRWPVLVFSLEMSSLQLMERLLCSAARIDSSLLRRGMIQKRDMSNLTLVADPLSKAPILIDDTPAASLREVRAKARRFRSMGELFGGKPFGLIVVDYLQLMRGNTSNAQATREQEISEISRGLKALAKEINCPIIALSQLNRSLESRQDKRPILSDLRESGAIEQDADQIFFIYREEVYKEQSDKQGIAEVIIGKNRHGATGAIELFFEGKFTRFSNLSRRGDAAAYVEARPEPPPPTAERTPF